MPQNIVGTSCAVALASVLFASSFVTFQAQEAAQPAGNVRAEHHCRTHSTACQHTDEPRGEGGSAGQVGE